jgi:multicomponent Na+:H+ antiporter subunit C
MTLAISAGLLVAAAVYLLQKRELLRVILGFVLLGHAVNLILIAAGGAAGREAPFGLFTDTEGAADPLPQAFVLTAIVIAFSITIFLLVLAVTGGRDDDTLDDEEADADDAKSDAGADDPHERTAARFVSDGTGADR